MNSKRKEHPLNMGGMFDPHTLLQVERKEPKTCIDIGVGRIDPCDDGSYEPRKPTVTDVYPKRIYPHEVWDVIEVWRIQIDNLGFPVKIWMHDLRVYVSLPRNALSLHKDVQNLIGVRLVLHKAYPNRVVYRVPFEFKFYEKKDSGEWLRRDLDYEDDAPITYWEKVKQSIELYSYKLGDEVFSGERRFQFIDDSGVLNAIYESVDELLENPEIEKSISEEGLLDLTEALLKFIHYQCGAVTEYTVSSLAILLDLWLDGDKEGIKYVLGYV